MTPTTADLPEAVFARERQEQIAQIVAEAGRARVTELARRFGVSAVTIRKDLLVLEGEGRLVRAHGGAIAPRTASRPELAFDLRERLQRSEKSRIGAAAAALVQDGDSIVFDASTTALSVARHLKEREAGTSSRSSPTASGSRWSSPATPASPCSCSAAGSAGRRSRSSARWATESSAG